MIRYATLYGIALVLFVAIDLCWLGYAARSLYRDGLGELMAPKLGLGAAAAFYLLFPVGLVVFAVAAQVPPEMVAGGWLRAMGYGALFGLLAYATYDLTNLATLRGFPLHLALIDMAWGTALSGGVSAATVLLARAVLPS